MGIKLYSEVFRSSRKTDSGTARGRLVSAALETFENFTQMIGFQDVFDFEDRFADAVKLETGD
jgi:hypothetical protein